MRGKVQFRSTVLKRPRITPAYAGKRTVSFSFTPFHWDHPRLCGEKLTAPETKRGETGSPPPMRGKGSSVILDCVISGITPAYAGKRSAAYCFGVRVEDHPRLCGEKNYEKRNKNEYQGSPPPMRGKVQNCFRYLCPIRITPAYAGKRNKKAH